MLRLGVERLPAVSTSCRGDGVPNCHAIPCTRHTDCACRQPPAPSAHLRITGILPIVVCPAGGEVLSLLLAFTGADLSVVDSPGLRTSQRDPPTLPVPPLLTDLKPANVLLKATPGDPRGWITKLADFGFTLLLERRVRHSCRTSVRRAVNSVN